MSVDRVVPDESDLDLKRSFTDLSLPESAFTHENHLRLGWVYIVSYPLSDAVDLFAEDLKTYATHVGASKKFNMTITWFYIMMINERQQRLAAKSWESFKTNSPKLFAPYKTLLSRRFSDTVLNSEKARLEVVLPDLQSNLVVG